MLVALIRCQRVRSGCPLANYLRTLTIHSLHYNQKSHDLRTSCSRLVCGLGTSPLLQLSEVTRKNLATPNTRYLLSRVVSGKSSVRNGDAGSPALLNRFGSAVSCHAKRTATGLRTTSGSQETLIVSPSITAMAG